MIVDETVSCFPVPQHDGATDVTASLSGYGCTPPMNSGGLQRDQIILVVLVCGAVACSLLFPVPVGIGAALRQTTTRCRTSRTWRRVQRFLCRDPTKSQRLAACVSDLLGSVFLVSAIILFATAAVASQRSRWFCDDGICGLALALAKSAATTYETVMLSTAELAVKSAALQLLVTAVDSAVIASNTSVMMSVGSSQLWPLDDGGQGDAPLLRFCSTSLGGSVWLLIVAAVLLSVRCAMRLLVQQLLRVGPDRGRGEAHSPSHDDGDGSIEQQRRHRRQQQFHHRNWYSPEDPSNGGGHDNHQHHLRHEYTSNTSADPTWAVTSTGHANDTDAVLSTPDVNLPLFAGPGYPPFYHQTLSPTTSVYHHHHHHNSQQLHLAKTPAALTLHVAPSVASHSGVAVAEGRGNGDAAASQRETTELLRSPVTQANLAHLQQTLHHNIHEGAQVQGETPPSVLEVDENGVTGEVLEEEDLSGADVQDWFREPHDAHPPLQPSQHVEGEHAPNSSVPSQQQQQQQARRPFSSRGATALQRKSMSARRSSALLGRHHRMTAPTEFPSSDPHIDPYLVGLTPSLHYQQQFQGASGSHMRNPLDDDSNRRHQHPLEPSDVTASSAPSQSSPTTTPTRRLLARPAQTAPPDVLEEVDGSTTSSLNSSSNDDDDDDAAFDMEPQIFRDAEWAADADTGMFWSPALMLFFDPSSKRYFDPRSSEWYARISDVPSSSSRQTA